MAGVAPTTQEPGRPVRISLQWLFGCVAVGAVVGYAAVGYWLGSDARDRLLRSPPERVQRITLSPHSGPPGTPLRGPVLVTDPAAIARVTEVFGESVSVAPSHPNTLWKCYLELATPVGTSYANVTRTSNYGVLVTVTSRPAGAGDSIGTYQNDRLGDLILELAGTAPGG